MYIEESTPAYVHICVILKQKETCSPYQLVFTVVMKNWDPFVLAPALAIDKTPVMTTIATSEGKL
jgi:hypothetical protein